MGSKWVPDLFQRGPIDLHKFSLYKQGTLGMKGEEARVPSDLIRVLCSQYSQFVHTRTCSSL